MWFFLGKQWLVQTSFQSTQCQGSQIEAFGTTDICGSLVLVLSIGAIPKGGFPKSRGTSLSVPVLSDYSILRSTLDARFTESIVSLQVRTTPKTLTLSAPGKRPSTPGGGGVANRFPSLKLSDSGCT